MSKTCVHTMDHRQQTIPHDCVLAFLAPPSMQSATTNPLACHLISEDSLPNRLNHPGPMTALKIPLILRAAHETHQHHFWAAPSSIGCFLGLPFADCSKERVPPMRPWPKWKRLVAQETKTMLMMRQRETKMKMRMLKWLLEVPLRRLAMLKGKRGGRIRSGQVSDLHDLPDVDAQGINSPLPIPTAPTTDCLVAVIIVSLWIDDGVKWWYRGRRGC